MNREKEGKEIQKKQEDKEYSIFFQELYFLIKLIFFLLLLPILLVYYLIKGKPKKAFDPLYKLLKNEFNKHSSVFFPLFINIIVFILFYVFSLLDHFFNTNLFSNIWKSIFVSSKENYYLFNLSFMAHVDPIHLITNLVFLYYTSYILNSKNLNVVKLYFIFGFLENLLLFILSFFIEIPNNLGASGVISAFLIISLIEYPFAFSIFFMFLYYLIFSDYFVAYFLSLNIFNFFNIIKEFSSINNLKLIEEQIFVFSHFLGYLVGLTYLIVFRFKESNKIKKIISLALFLLVLWLLFKVLIFATYSNIK